MLWLKLAISEVSGTAHKLRQQSKDREQNEEKWRDSNKNNDQVPHLDHGSTLASKGGLCLSRRKIDGHLRGKRDFLSHGLLFLHRTRMKKARDRDTWLCQSEITVDSYKNRRRGRERNMWICQWLYMHQSLMGGTWVACGVPRDTEVHTSPWAAQGPHHSKHGLTLKTP